MRNTTPTREAIAAESDRRMALSHLKGVEAALLDHDPNSAVTILRDLSHKVYDYYLRTMPALNAVKSRLDEIEGIDR